MKQPPEMNEGPEAFTRFDATVKTLLSVSREDLMRRERAYKEKAALNPRKRGPKSKRTPVVPGPDA